MTANDAASRDVETPSAEAMQRAFARLVTSARARARFAVDPHAEAPELAALPARHVEFYARGLLAKRFAEVRRLLPHVARTPGLAERFRAHAETYAPGGHGRHRSDAIAFARALERGGTTHDGNGAARVDRLALEAGRGGRFLAVAFAHGHVHVWLRPTRAAALRAGRFAFPHMRRERSRPKPIR